jgi:hypothetical protein
MAVWRIGFCLIAMNARTRAAPSRVPRNEIMSFSDAKRFTELLQTRRPDAVCAVLIFLNLLERDTGRIGEFRLAQSQ